MGNDPRVLVIGSDGTIGAAVATRLESLGATVLRTTRQGIDRTIPLDLTADSDRWHLPRSVSVAVICAAVTSTEACRDHPDIAYRVNVEGTLAVGRRLAEAGARIVFPSTNMVFDGTVPFTPAPTKCCPKTTYGRMKAEAEAGLLAIGVTTVVRLTKVIGRSLPVIDRWKESLRRGEPIRPLVDLQCAPVSLDLAAEVIAMAALRPLDRIVQLSARADVSYADVAARVVDRCRVASHLLQPVTATQLGLQLEHLPAHTTLDSSSIADRLRIEAPDPWVAIDAMCANLAP